MNTGNDLYPSWIGLDDIAYSFAPGDQGGNDGCVGHIPAHGGTRLPFACRGHASSDSIANVNWPSVSADARVAYVWELLRAGTKRPDSAFLFVQPAADTGTPREVLRFPYAIPGVDLYTSATHVGWLNADTIIAVAVGDVLIRDCAGCAFRYVRSGRAVILLDISATSPTPVIVSGTTAASAVTPGPTGHDFYYTLTGDSSVYHRDLTGGSAVTTYDFGAAGIARDPQLAGNRLVAIVGGNVVPHVDPIAGLVQEDFGGPIHLVDLVSGTDSTLPTSGLLYRHPALSRTGGALVVEGWSGGLADLWFIELP